MSEPVYQFRVIRKGLSLEDAQRICAENKAKRPQNDYRVVMLDGADPYYRKAVYRVLMLRPADLDKS